MGNVGDAAFSKGDVMRRLHELERLINAFAYGRSLESATIGSGGLRVIDNGEIIVEEGGAITAFGPNGGYTRLVDGELRFLSGNFSVDIPGRLIAQQGPIRGLWIVPPRPQGDALGDNWIFVFARDGSSAVGRVGMTTTGLIDLDAGTNALIDAAESVNITAGNDAFLTAADSVDVTGDGGAFFTSTNGQVQIRSGISQVFIEHETTANAANCYLTSFGQVMRSTSSSRYKQDIADFVVNPREVLTLQPRRWRDKHEVDRSPDTDRQYVGFVAEEVEEAGLDAFVEYDAEGRPESIAYDRLSVALLAVVKDQDTRLKALEARLTALDGQSPGRTTVDKTIIPHRLSGPETQATLDTPPAPPDRPRSKVEPEPEHAHWADGTDH